jgi:hypothetical protein
VTIEGKITVAAWTDSPRPTICERTSNRRFCPPAIIGLVGTLLLHTLAFQTALTGDRARKIRPPEVQHPGLSMDKSESKPADRLVFVDLSGVARSDVEIGDAAALIQPPMKMNPIKMTTPDSLPSVNIPLLSLDDEKEFKTSGEGTDTNEHARLFGIYSGQIQARVERIWTRPRSPVNDGTNAAASTNAVEYFHCQVQIVQDSTGNVQEVLLPNCNGSVAWQRSLVVAIQQASPLPAPPSPDVFTRNMSMNFIGYPHVAGGSDEGYEVLRVETAQVCCQFDNR